MADKIDLIMQFLSADPATEAQSDVEISATLSLPAYTLRDERITFATLANVWGADRTTEFKAGLRTLQKSDDAQSAALGDFVLGLLDGTGFAADSPDATRLAERLIALGLCSDREVTLALNYEIFPVGEAATVDEVGQARAKLARIRMSQDLRNRLNTGIANAETLLAELELGQVATVSFDEVLAQVATG